MKNSAIKVVVDGNKMEASCSSCNIQLERVEQDIIFPEWVLTDIKFQCPICKYAISAADLMFYFDDEESVLKLKYRGKECYQK